MMYEKSIPGGAYWCDDNGNMWSVGTHTKEDAEKASASLSDFLYIFASTFRQKDFISPCQILGKKRQAIPDFY